MTYEELVNSSIFSDLFVKLSTERHIDKAKTISTTIKMFGKEAVELYADYADIVDYLYSCCCIQHGEHYTIKQLIDPSISTYLLIEDTGAGMDFWKCILDSLDLKCNLTNPSIVLRKSSGGLHGVLKSLQKLEGTTDTYYVLCDDDLTNRSEKHLSDLEDVKRLCKGNFVLLPNYICFESLFIGFKEIVEWYKQLNPGATWTKLESDIINLRNRLTQKPYNRVQLKKYRNYVYTIGKIINDANKNVLASLEETCSYALTSLSSTSGNRISKGHIGDCWWKDCCTEKRPCKLLDKNISNKLLYVFTNSYYTQIVRDIK